MKPRKRIVSVLLVTGALLFCLWNWRVESRTVKITILPLNGGEAIFVDQAGRANDLLVDCGNANSAQFILQPFLRAQGVNSIANVLLTHGDLRNIGGKKLIEQSFAVKKIFTSPVSAKSSAYQKIITELREQPKRWNELVRGNRLSEWSVLHPENADEFSQADDKAVVLRGNIFGKTILLLSDLGRPGQNALLERQDDLRADIVVAGIPEQGEPLCDALLERIQPDVIVITDCEFPATQRAPRKLSERLARQNIEVIYCRESGAVTFLFSERGWLIKTARGRQSQWSAAVSRSGGTSRSVPQDQSALE